MLLYHSPGRGAADSLPIGNGHWGANVWTDNDGSIMVYLGANDSWSGNGRLIKVARLRLRVGADSTWRTSGRDVRYRIELDENEATVSITIEGSAGTCKAKLWIDAHRDVLWIELAVPERLPVSLATEPWRLRRRKVADEWELHSFVGQRLEDGDIWVEADEISADDYGVASFHRNGPSMVSSTVEHQGLGDCIDLVEDPLDGRVSGVYLHAPLSESVETEAVRDSAWRGEVRLPAGPAKALFAVDLLTRQYDDPCRWLAEIRRSAAETKRIASSFESGRREHERWWRQFWDRSAIEINGDDDAVRVTESYRMHRYLIGCAGRGPHPIKFNGSLFNVEGERDGRRWDADYRLWGGGYWFQNTRLIYWSLLESGDFDMIRPFAEMYRSMLPFARERTRRYFGHGGVFFPETLTLWGTYLNSNYGYDRTDRHISHVENSYIRRYWVGALELLALLLDWRIWSGDSEVVRRYLLPIGEEVLTFYLEHYPERTADGRMVISPAQSLETWHEAVDPAPEIAGLRYLRRRLDATAAAGIEDGLDDLAARAAAIDAMLPELPARYHVWQKASELLPARSYDIRSNMENPALYAVFPFRLYGVGKPDLQTGRFSYERREERHLGGWSQDAIQSALLGMAGEAKRCVVTHARMRNEGARFPAFWGPNYDWIPDMDHGGVLMIALQRMLLTGDPDRIDVAPAWPAEWRASFRLNGPCGTTVCADIDGGSVRYLSTGDFSGTVVVHEPQPAMER